MLNGTVAASRPDDEKPIVNFKEAIELLEKFEKEKGERPEREAMLMCEGLKDRLCDFIDSPYATKEGRYRALEASQNPMLPGDGFGLFWGTPVFTVSDFEAFLHPQMSLDTVLIGSLEGVQKIIVNCKNLRRKYWVLDLWRDRWIKPTWTLPGYLADS